MKDNNIKITHPRLLEEWNYKKNNELGIYPEDYTSGSTKKIWWECSRNNVHEWETDIANKIKSKSNGCPYCSNKRVLKGYNDLNTTNPNIANEWHPTKNGDLKPTQVTAGSGKKAWWKCSEGHEWEAIVNDRKSGKGCLKCAKENQTSFPEKVIYYYIKKIFSDAIENYKDICLNKYELDIYIPSLRLGIEYDGGNWHTDINKDLEKDKLCFNNNIKIIRIREPRCPEINNSSKIFILKNKKDNELEKSLQEMINYINKTFDLKNKITINISKDKVDIYKLINIQKKSKSLQTINSKLSSEWHPTKNGILTPTQVTSRSGKKVWWKCSEGHEWEAIIKSRNNGNGCPYCSNQKVLKGYNDLATTNPKIASEWHPTKNGDLKPTQVTLGSNKKVWWQCENCHEWEVTVDNRNSGRNCPYCSNHKVLEGHNDLATTNPNIANQWHPTKNGDLKPTQFKSGSHKEVWWQCKKCNYEWQEKIEKMVKRHKCKNCKFDIIST